MITQPDLTIAPWADSGDRIQPDPSYIASGFVRSPDKPTRQTMNYALNYAWNGVQYLASRGIPEWRATQNYAMGDVVRAAGKFYSATAASVNRNPPSSPGQWALWYVFLADLNALYITPAQANAVYLPRTEAASTYVTSTTLNTTRDNLQNQINAIVTVTGRGYFPGSGISISGDNVISNTAPNVNADWNAGVGTPGHILNKPTFATVASSGSYNDLSNRPALAPVATTGNYNSLTNLPTIPAAQVRADWLSVSGLTSIANRPEVFATLTGLHVTLPDIGDAFVRLHHPNTVDYGDFYLGISYREAYLWHSLGMVHIKTSHLAVDGNVTASGHVNAGGYATRPGIGTAFSGHNFNIDYLPGSNQVTLWIDNTNMGGIAFQSDYRLKKNVEPITDALPLVMKLRPVIFNWQDVPDDLWRSDGAVHAGLIAHEVQEVFPGAAEGEKDALTTDGKIQPQRLNQSDLIALLTSALQELSEKVSRLESDMHDIHPGMN